MEITKRKERNLFNPWPEFRRLQSEINDLFNLDRFSESINLFGNGFFPPVDISEDNDHITVSCELPGLEHKDLDISLTSTSLTIKGKKKGETEKKEKDYYKKESWSGSFRRTVSLPYTINTGNAKADLKNGILTIVLQKNEEAKPKKIKISV